MKKLLLFSAGWLLTMSLLAQAPDFFHYQALLRNSDGTLRSGEEVSIMVELLRGSVEGMSVYLENHQVVTDPRGMVTLKIGDGTFFNEIEWDRGSSPGTFLSAGYCLGY